MTLKFIDITGKRGIDISAFQDNKDNKLPDLGKAKLLGSDFVIIRTGYGIVEDRMLGEFIRQAKGVMDIALYHYLDYYSYSAKWVSCTPAEWGKRQAQFVWALMQKYGVTNCTVFIDVENANNHPGVEQVWPTVNVIKYNFLVEIDRLNKKTNGIYCSTGLLPKIDPKHHGRPLFAANYNDISIDRLKVIVKSAGFVNLVIWQYQSNGDIDGDKIGDGIRMGLESKALDLDIFLGNDEQYEVIFGAPDNTPVVVEPTDSEKLAKLWVAHPELH